MNCNSSYLRRLDAGVNPFFLGWFLDPEGKLANKLTRAAAEKEKEEITREALREK